MAERLILKIPNIPYGPAEDISDEEWKWIRHNHPADYKYAQKLIKAHEAENPTDGEKADNKPQEAARPSEASTSATRSAGKEGK